MNASRAEFLVALRWFALSGAIAGAVGALVFMRRAGRHSPAILLAMFAIWVTSPYLGLIWGCTVSKRWSVPARAMLYGLALIVALASLVAYGTDVWRPPTAKAASVFIVVPFVSWLLIGISALISVRLSRGKASDPRGT